MAKRKPLKKESRVRGAKVFKTKVARTEAVFADPFSSTLRESDDLFSRVRRVAGVQVDSAALREEIKTFVKNYFRILRPILSSESIETSELDQLMQELLAFANSRTSASIYRKSFNAIRQHLVRIEGVREVVNSGRLSQGLSLQQKGTHGRDAEIIATLEKTVPTAAISYRQALDDIGKLKVSYRGTAAELREVLREVLDYLAPDAEVRAITSFKLEEGTRGPTMKQKVHYILKSRKKSATAIEAPEEAASVVDEGIAKLVRATYNRGSLLTHTQGEGQSEALQIKMYLDTVLCELLEIH